MEELLETRQLQVALREAQLQLSQLREEKRQIQKCYDKAIQEVAGGETKREVVEKELRLAHDQISDMWQELETLRTLVDHPTPTPPSKLPKDQSFTTPPVVPADVLCRLCQGKVNLDQTISSHSTEKHPENGFLPAHLNSEKQPKAHQDHPPKQLKSRKSWFGRKQFRVQELDPRSKTTSRSNPSSPSRTRYASSCSPSGSPTLRRKAGVTGSPLKTVAKGAWQGEEFLQVNVTRSSHGIADMSPFKIVTKTNSQCFPCQSMEVYRSQGDFQWLYSALQGACPECIVPPLRPPISLDATISEFQRFLCRVSAHKTLSAHHLFTVFLAGTAEELRALRAKHRPHGHTDKTKYKPAMGRDTNSGPLVDTKDYLTMLEQNLVGLTGHLEHSNRRGRGSPMERSAHWFSAISDSEPHHTYLRRASADLARTCEGMEGQLGDSDESLFIQNLQSLTDYIRVAQNLLTRVEEAVDQYLYWDEEVTIIEAVNSSPKAEHSPPPRYDDTKSENAEIDDSGISDVNSSSTGDGSHTHSEDHVTIENGSHDLTDSTDSSSERWAHASKNCADAKDYLEVMCNDLTDELSFFDLQKEKEVKQILLDYATAQLERHEKFQGKWFAMKFILDSPIAMDKRAIQFNPVPATPTSPSPS